MRTSLIVLLATSAALTAAEEPLRIRTSQGFAQPGGAIQVTCSVAKNAHNRNLEMGVRNEQQSRRQLDGEVAIVTHQMWVKKISCDAGPAFCELTTDDGKVRRLERPFQMIGCPDRESGLPFD